jgi:hypothetical protein
MPDPLSRHTIDSDSRGGSAKRDRKSTKVTFVCTKVACRNTKVIYLIIGNVAIAVSNLATPKGNSA